MAMAGRDPPYVLASALLTPDTKLWTLDKRLLRLATRLRAAHRAKT